jgi:hypothetical protein
MSVYVPTSCGCVVATRNVVGLCSYLALWLERSASPYVYVVDNNIHWALMENIPRRVAVLLPHEMLLKYVV